MDLPIILLISNCPENAATVKFILGLGGYRVDAVRELDEAINWMKMRGPYDLLLLDGVFGKEQPAIVDEFLKTCGTSPMLLPCRGGGSATIPEHWSTYRELSVCLPDELCAEVEKLLKQQKSWSKGGADGTNGIRSRQSVLNFPPGG